MRTLELPNGTTIPVLGQGTWNMGDDAWKRSAEIATLHAGVELGLSMIDTAEMYGNGASERLVGEAIADRRDKVFLVSKVLPAHAARAATIKACERSLQRLGTDHIDLYLLHWRGNDPLHETVAAFEKLKTDGKIRGWGVSNFDREDMDDLRAVPGGEHVQTNQVLYNLGRRGIEHDLLPYCQQQGIPITAYSPIEQARLLSHKKLNLIAKRCGYTPAQLALAWVLRVPGVIAIPKSASRLHVRENAGALEVELGERELSELDDVFAPPTGKVSLEML